MELFRDEATASAYLEKQVAEIAESRGRLHQGVKIAAAGRFDVDEVGDEAHGFTATLSSGDLSLFTTGVAFRRGRVVGSVDVLQALELESSAEMKRVADELDDRIKDVMAGEIEKTAGLTRTRDWRRAGPDPRRLTLAAKDLSLPMSPTHRRYLRTPNLNGYFRKYESVRPVPLGASKIFTSAPRRQCSGVLAWPIATRNSSPRAAEAKRSRAASSAGSSAEPTSGRARSTRARCRRPTATAPSFNFPWQCRAGGSDSSWSVSGTVDARQPSWGWGLSRRSTPAMFWPSEGHFGHACARSH